MLIVQFKAENYRILKLFPLVERAITKASFFRRMNIKIPNCGFLLYLNGS
jgi:hypothetical protein